MDLSAPALVIKALRSIARQGGDKDLRNRILKTYFQTILLGGGDTTRKVANVAGYQINYVNYQLFKYLFKEIFIEQGYYFKSSNDDSPLIIDCGSNIGMSVLYFKLTHPTSRIIAFEPDEAAFSCLEKNVKDNALQSVDVNNKAVSGSDGKIDLYYDADNPGSLKISTVRERMPKQRKQVDAVRLSNYITKEVEFLKMDIEGAELDVMRELSDSGRLRSIRQMAIEYHHHIVKDEDVFSKILGVLENSGFGYQVSSGLGRPFDRNKFQDILIYAYRKPFA